MAANQAPRPTCLFSEAAVCRLRLLERAQDRGDGQDRQQPGLRAPSAGSPS